MSSKQLIDLQIGTFKSQKKYFENDVFLGNLLPPDLDGLMIFDENFFFFNNHKNFVRNVNKLQSYKYNLTMISPSQSYLGKYGLFFDNTASTRVSVRSINLPENI